MHSTTNRCLIFDLDGTLVDSLPGIATSLNRALAAHHLPTHPEETVRRFVGDGLETLVRRASAPDPGDALVATLIRTFKDAYETDWQSGTIPYPGVAAMLESLQNQGFQLAVLSNKTHPFTVAMVHGVFPTIRFAAVLGQRDHIPHKPHPDGALEIARSVGLPPSRCTVIGDSTIDLAAAANAGMAAVAVSWGYHDIKRLLAAGADPIAHTTDELLSLLTGAAAPSAESSQPARS
jgi:phosphoglycolate phosphatase